jgi:hypothetical protein
MRLPECPFCASHLLTVTNRTERLTYKCCERCYKRWAEPDIDLAAIVRCLDDDKEREPEPAVTIVRRP